MVEEPPAKVETALEVESHEAKEPISFISPAKVDMSQTQPEMMNTFNGSNNSKFNGQMHLNGTARETSTALWKGHSAWIS